MTRREMLQECRDGALRALPQALGMAGGLWGGLSRLLEQDKPVASAPAECFPEARPTNESAPTQNGVGE